MKFCITEICQSIMKVEQSSSKNNKEICSLNVLKCKFAVIPISPLLYKPIQLEYTTKTVKPLQRMANFLKSLKRTFYFLSSILYPSKDTSLLPGTP